MVMASPLPLRFRIRRIWLFLGLLYVGCILVFQYTTLQRGPGQSDFSFLAEGDVVAYLNRFFYYFPLELVSIGVVIYVLLVYRRWFKLYTLPTTPYSLLRYELSFLPAVVLAIPLFCPLTNTLRYALLYANEWGWSYYFPGYFFTWQMFLNYLLPVLIFGYGFINVNLILDYFDWQPPASQESSVIGADQARSALAQPTVPGEATDTPLSVHIGSQDSSPPALCEPARLRRVIGLDTAGQTHVWVDHVHYFDVQHKVYAAHTADGVYAVHKTLAELEIELDPRSFYRVNRSVIINLHYVKNYSHWEYDKYIVRLKDSKAEFVMQRSHLKTLRERLDQLLH